MLCQAELTFGPSICAHQVSKTSTLVGGPGQAMHDIAPEESARTSRQLTGTGFLRPSSPRCLFHTAPPCAAPAGGDRDARAAEVDA